MGPTCVFVPTFCCEMMLLYNYHWKSVKIGIFVLIRILFLPDLTYFTIWFCSFFQLFDHSNLEMIRTCVITTSQNTQREIRWVSLLFWHSLKQVFCVRRNEWETSQPVSHWFDDLLWIRRICFLWLSVDFIACRCCCCLFLLCSNHCDMYQTKKLIILSEFGALFMRDASIVMMWLKLNFNVIVELWFAPFVPNCNKKNLRVFYAMLSHRAITNANCKSFSVWWVLLLLLSLHNYILNENSSYTFAWKLFLYSKKKCCDHIDLRQKESTN